MELRNCPRCKALFSYDGIKICTNCRAKDEEDFLKLREYLRNHDGASISELSLALEISMEKIKMFMREGRLEVKGQGQMILECEKCGTVIESGKFCSDCQAKLMNGLQGAVDNDREKAESKSDKEASRDYGGFRFLRKKE